MTSSFTENMKIVVSVFSRNTNDDFEFVKAENRKKRPNAEYEKKLFGEFPNWALKNKGSHEKVFKSEKGVYLRASLKAFGAKGARVRECMNCVREECL